MRNEEFCEEKEICVWVSILIDGSGESGRSNVVLETVEEVAVETSVKIPKDVFQ